jgi:hypothetical protein
LNTNRRKFPVYAFEYTFGLKSDRKQEKKEKKQRKEEEEKEEEEGEG